MVEKWNVLYPLCFIISIPLNIFNFIQKFKKLKEDGETINFPFLPHTVSRSFTDDLCFFHSIYVDFTCSQLLDLDYFLIIRFGSRFTFNQDLTSVLVRYYNDKILIIKNNCKIDHLFILFIVGL